MGIINEGYEIVKIIKTHDEDAIERGFAIAKAISEKTPAQWVTWRYWKYKKLDFFSGNYFLQEWNAYEDFYRRLMEHYQR